MTRILSPIVVFLTLSSCSTLVGNVKPFDEKSTTYGVLDLARENSQEWTRLDDSQLRPKDAQIGTNKKAFSSEVTDVAYQSRKTSAIISLNSSCRDGRVTPADLAPYLRELLLGMTDVVERTETRRKIADTEALETIVAGKMAGERTKIQALVLADGGCIYDLMYIARPERFPIHTGDFNRFVSSLRLR